MSDFGKKLLAAAEAGNVDDSEFLTRLRDGKCSLEELRLYGYRIARSAARLPVIFGSILTHCPDRSIRRGIVENLMEEEGFEYSGKTGGIVMRAGESHAEHVLRFARRLGIDDRQIARETTRKGNDWLTVQIRHGHWRKLLAYFTVGLEINVTHTFRIVAPSLRRHYGFSEEDTIFFSEHISIDEKHGALGLQMVLSVSGTPAEQEEALEGVRHGALAWRWLHNQPVRLEQEPAMQGQSI